MHSCKEIKQNFEHSIKKTGIHKMVTIMGWTLLYQLKRRVTEEIYFYPVMKMNQNDLFYLCVSVYVHIHSDFTEAQEGIRS